MKISRAGSNSQPLRLISLNFAAFSPSANSEKAVQKMMAALKRIKQMIRILFLMFGFFSFGMLTMKELYHDLKISLKEVCLSFKNNLINFFIAVMV